VKRAALVLFLLAGRRCDCDGSSDPPAVVMPTRLEGTDDKRGLLFSDVSGPPPTPVGLAAVTRFSVLPDGFPGPNTYFDYGPGEVDTLTVSVDPKGIVSEPVAESLIVQARASYAGNGVYELLMRPAVAINVRLLCLAPGKTTLTLDVKGFPYEGGGRATAATTVALECTAGSAKPREFANGVGTLTTVSQSGGAFVFTTGGVTSNLGERTADIRDRFVLRGDHCETFSGVGAFTSERGATPVTVTTGRQTGTATYSEATRRYAWTGFVSGDFYGNGEDVRLSFDGTNVTVRPPPPFGPPAETLSGANGLATTLSIPDGEATHVVVFGQLAPGSGFNCLYPTSALPLANGRRTAPLFDPVIQAAIPDVATTVTNVFAAKGNVVTTDRLFPAAGERDFLAVQMLRIPRSILGL